VEASWRAAETWSLTKTESNRCIKEDGVRLKEKSGIET